MNRLFDACFFENPMYGLEYTYSIFMARFIYFCLIHNSIELQFISLCC